MTHLSVVVPVYNESSLIEELVKRVLENIKLITEDFEIILVDDGSQDQTWELIEFESKSDKRIKGIKFSRNFGHHYAITAGLHNAKGDLVVIMDGDLQDRPEVIPDLYKKAEEGYDVVFVSRQNRPETFFYLLIQKIFYFMLRKLSGVNFDSSQANFSIISRKVVEAFKSFPENSRFYGSTILWLGFNRTQIQANHGMRFAGNSSYSIGKRLKLAFDIILAFSERPLRFAIGLGLVISTFSLIGVIAIIIGNYYWGFTVIGWASLVTSIFFIGGVTLTVLGIQGIYIGRIFQQVKNRPLFIISESKNL
jgi:glycosyltransferase involved in cell wall biosynthesis